MKKYFTPSIEDIRVGYECQILYPNYGNMAAPPVWLERIVDNQILMVIGRGDHPIDTIRVPYLTKEQIESEGWKKVKNITGALAKTIVENNYTFIKNGYCFQYYPDIYEGKILYFAGIYPSDILYKGTCKDINTFRYICKLLNIN